MFDTARCVHGYWTDDRCPREATHVSPFGTHMLGWCEAHATEKATPIQGRDDG